MREYPTVEELERIKNWDRTLPVMELLDDIESLWHWPEWGFKKHQGLNSLRRKVLKVELHTGGWSGNEEIIMALQENVFWLLYWEKSIRGGHYYFEIPKSMIKGQT